MKLRIFISKLNSLPNYVRILLILITIIIFSASISFVFSSYRPLSVKAYVQPGDTVLHYGADASARPSASQYKQIKAEGFDFMGRYLEINSNTGAQATGGKPYFLTVEELNDAAQAGVDLFLIFEWCRSEDWSKPLGYANGVRDAQIAQKALQRLGLPSTTPVYYSLDRVWPVNDNDIEQEITYFQGVLSVVGNVDAVGAYASKEELLALRNHQPEPLISWLWHATWKYHEDTTGWGSHMYQITYDKNLKKPGGVAIDENFAFSDSFGQIGVATGAAEVCGSTRQDNLTAIFRETTFYDDSGINPQCNKPANGIQSVASIAQQEYNKNKGELSFSEDSTIAFEGSDYTDGIVEHWCADFVSWIYKQAGIPFSDGAKGWRIGGVASLIDYFKNKQLFIEIGNQNPQPGDLIFYATSEGDGSNGSHVEVVISYDSTTRMMTYIGGNECSGDNSKCNPPNSEVARGTITLDVNGTHGNIIGFGRYQ